MQTTTLPGTGTTVALFATCIADTMKPSVPIATVKLLERLGCNVVFPESQTCCGQITTNTGYPERSVGTVKNYVDTFGAYDYIVAPSGSCVGAVRHQHEMVAEKAGDKALARIAKQTAARTHDIAEFLIDVLGVDNVGAYFPHTVTYHPSCHGMRIAKLGDRPMRLLKAVEGIDIRELTDADQCCGFGGTFSIKNPDISAAMVEDKANHVAETGAEYLVGGDHACLMNIIGRMHRQGRQTQAIHLVEILASTKEDAR